ncbi:hypothetical protein GCM10027449_26350 [Sinomonas notoginsengisoli]|uniref:hypothetical protein n=1 Tax=Sinomonas notoginsengisoli TaxID=1457311 RepID=UPI001F288185|nr:hypothetical protein [Sinomonas notoginsengisoli]
MFAIALAALAPLDADTLTALTELNANEAAILAGLDVPPLDDDHSPTRCELEAELAALDRP